MFFVYFACYYFLESIPWIYIIWIWQYFFQNILELKLIASNTSAIYLFYQWRAVFFILFFNFFIKYFFDLLIGNNWSYWLFSSLIETIIFLKRISFDFALTFSALRYTSSVWFLQHKKTVYVCLWEWIKYIKLMIICTLEKVEQ